MNYNYTHLAKYSRVKRPTMLDMIRSMIRPARGHVDSLMRSMGLVLGATYNYRGGYVSGTNTGPVSTPNGFTIGEIIMDFAAIKTARTTAGQAALAAADILELFEVPAGTWVPATFVEVLTVEGETATVGIGDGAGTSGFQATVDANALTFAGSLVTSAYSVAVGGGKLYTALDTIDMILNTAAFDVSKIRTVVCMVDLRRQRTL